MTFNTKKHTLCGALTAVIFAAIVFTGCAKPVDSSKLTIYIVRHGQTIFNLMDRVQGISDGILTEKGIIGAENMGKGLRDVPFTAVYSSDLGRARETARIAMEQNTATDAWMIYEKPELREVSFGIYEGDLNYMMYAAFGKDLGLNIPADARDIMTASKPILEYYNGDFLAFLEGLADYNKRIDTQYKISEDASEVKARLQSGVDQIIAENPKGGNVMLVAHGQSINFLLPVLKLDTGGAPLGNSSVTKVVYNYAAKTFTLDGPVGDMSYVKAGEGM
jgi:probable phosphoglycerate mutase